MVAIDIESGLKPEDRITSRKEHECISLMRSLLPFSIVDFQVQSSSLSDWQHS